MRIAVYTIALNEEQFVQRWADSLLHSLHNKGALNGTTNR
jgi:hypothetical protein